MFFNSNQIFVNQFRSQTLAKRRLQLLSTNRSIGFKYKNFATNGGTKADSVWDSIKEKFTEKMIVFAGLLRQQSNVYMSLRLRRMAQICGLYNRIYSESTAKRMMSQMMVRLRNRALNTFKNRLNNPKSKESVKCVMSAVCGLFVWDNQRITDCDLSQTVHDFELIRRATTGFDHSKDSHLDNLSKSNSFSVSAESYGHNKETQEKTNSNDNQWEELITRDDFRLWRKSVPNSSLYEYKVFGTFNDIPARVFFRVQMDLEFRKKWDKLVIKLDVVEKEPFVTDKEHQSTEDSGNELLHWIMRYPYPMNTRDYVYLRRSRVDYKNNLMVLVSKSIDHPNIPETEKHVRVYDYSSQMVIQPHSSFDECGFDYMLTYFDDPRAAFPSPAYNWMASCGVTDFLDKLHSAAVQLYKLNPNQPNQRPNVYPNKNFNSTKNPNHSSECIYA